MPQTVKNMWFLGKSWKLEKITITAHVVYQRNNRFVMDLTKALNLLLSSLPQQRKITIFVNAKEATIYLIVMELIQKLTSENDHILQSSTRYYLKLIIRPKEKNRFLRCKKFF